MSIVQSPAPKKIPNDTFIVGDSLHTHIERRRTNKRCYVQGGDTPPVKHNFQNPAMIYVILEAFFDHCFEKIAKALAASRPVRAYLTKLSLNWGGAVIPNSSFCARVEEMAGAVLEQRWPFTRGDCSSPLPPFFAKPAPPLPVAASHLIDIPAHPTP